MENVSGQTASTERSLLCIRTNRMEKPRCVYWTDWNLSLGQDVLKRVRRRLMHSVMEYK